MNVIICPTTCWGCKFDYHNPERHSALDAEDIEYYQEAGLPLPDVPCGCYCTRTTTTEEENSEAVRAAGHGAA